MDKRSELLTASRAVAALMGVYRDSLMQNGFTRKEAVELCKTYTFALVTKPKERETDE